MKLLFPFTMLFVVPFIFCAFLLAVAIPLFIQHFFRSEEKVSHSEYPYLTSWEEAA